MPDIDYAAEAPATDPLASAMHAAYERGDKGKAQELMNQRNARASAGGDSQNVEPVPAETAQEAVPALAALPGGSELMREWGGASSPDFAANLGYANLAVNHLREHNPAMLEYLQSEFEDEDGNTYRPGDDAAMVKLAAQFGRLLAHRDGLAAEPVSLPRQSTRQRGVNQMSQPSSPSRAGEARMNELTKELHAALAARDSMRAQEINRERDELAHQLHGNAPIVGRGGRNV